MIADPSGNYLFVLDHDAPDNAAPSSTDNCALALGTSVTTCGDITVFKIDQNTGRLSLVVNAQVTAVTSAQPITYFPVPANPVDFLICQRHRPHSCRRSQPDFLSVHRVAPLLFPYNYSGSTGQLTLSQNSSQPLGFTQATAMVSAGGVIYVLDNEPITVSFNGVTTTSPSQILPFTVGTGGALAGGAERRDSR